MFNLPFAPSFPLASVRLQKVHQPGIPGYEKPSHAGCNASRATSFVMEWKVQQPWQRASALPASGAETAGAIVSGLCGRPQPACCHQHPSHSHQLHNRVHKTPNIEKFGSAGVLDCSGRATLDLVWEPLYPCVNGIGLLELRLQ